MAVVNVPGFGAVDSQDFQEALRAAMAAEGSTVGASTSGIIAELQKRSSGGEREAGTGKVSTPPGTGTPGDAKAVPDTSRDQELADLQRQLDELRAQAEGRSKKETPVDLTVPDITGDVPPFAETGTATSDDLQAWLLQKLSGSPDQAWGLPPLPNLEGLITQEVDLEGNVVGFTPTPQGRLLLDLWQNIASQAQTHDVELTFRRFGAEEAEAERKRKDEELAIARANIFGQTLGGEITEERRQALIQEQLQRERAALDAAALFGQFGAPAEGQPTEEARQARFREMVELAGLTGQLGLGDEQQLTESARAQRAQEELQRQELAQQMAQFLLSDPLRIFLGQQFAGGQDLQGLQPSPQGLTSFDFLTPFLQEQARTPSAQEFGRLTPTQQNLTAQIQGLRGLAPEDFLANILQATPAGVSGPVARPPKQRRF